MREITAVLQTALKKNVSVGMHLDVYVWIWFKLSMMIDTIELYILILVWPLLWRSQECKKAKDYLPIISQNFQSIWMEFGVLSRLVGVMNLILILSHLFKGEDLTCMISFSKKKKYIGLYSDIYWPISCRLCIIVETNELYILISAWMTLIFI